MRKFREMLFCLILILGLVAVYEWWLGPYLTSLS